MGSFVSSFEISESGFLKGIHTMMVPNMSYSSFLANMYSLVQIFGILGPLQTRWQKKKKKIKQKRATCRPASRR